MEKLIPYSVHLPPALHKKLKAAAKDRKASGLVRDAITAALEDKTMFEQGYDSGVDFTLQIIMDHPLMNSLQWQGESMAGIITGLVEAKRG